MFVLEGKRRVRSADSTELRQRRSGTQFWSASERCAKLLRLLGVPVVQAEAEGEALCALLNARGIVDGVISNDGDCFLFGAKTVYTKFTVENIENGQVMRYDASMLSAVVDPSNFAKDADGTSSSSPTEFITLSREDLIAFALLTGSDLVGGGIPHVGYKKAINLLHACKRLKHRPNERCCLDELLAWGDAVSKQTSVTNGELCMQCDDDGPSTISERCCTLCLHPGDKLQHEKHGCAKCGTDAGEGCIVVTIKEKFLRSVRDKALKMPSFANRSIVDEYFSPNSNILPNDLNQKKAQCIISPDAQTLFSTALIVKGHTSSSSNAYIRETLPHLLARLELWADPRNKYSLSRLFKPTPNRIEKEFTKDFTQCYEIVWSIELGDEEMLEFSTSEPQALVQNSRYSNICKDFHQADRRRRQELDRHKHFIGQKPKAHKGRPLNPQQREKNFQRSMKPVGRMRRERNFANASTGITKPSGTAEQSSDVTMLMGSILNARVSAPKLDEPVEDELLNGLEASSQRYKADADIANGEFGDQRSVDEEQLFDAMDASNEWKTESQNNGKLCFTSKSVDTHHLFDESETQDLRYEDEDALEESSGFCDTESTNGRYWKSDHKYFNQIDFSQEGTFSEYRYDDYSCQDDGCMHKEEARNDGSDYSGRDSHDYNSFRNDGLKGSSFQYKMPLLSPSNEERLFVDFGIPIEVTPIVSRRWR